MEDDHLRHSTRHLSRYPYVLVVCTLRTGFAEEALPESVHRLEIPDFDHDAGDAIRLYTSPITGSRHD